MHIKSFVKLSTLSILSWSSLISAMEESKEENLTVGPINPLTLDHSKLLKLNDFTLPKFKQFWELSKKNKNLTKFVSEYLINFHIFSKNDQDNLLETILNTDQERLFNLITSLKLTAIQDKRILDLVDGQIRHYYERNNLLHRLPQVLKKSEQKELFYIRGQFPESLKNLLKKEINTNNIWGLNNPENLKEYLNFNPKPPYNLMARIVLANYTSFSFASAENLEDLSKQGITVSLRPNKKKIKTINKILQNNLFNNPYYYKSIESYLRMLANENKILHCSHDLLITAWTLLWSIPSDLEAVSISDKTNFTNTVSELCSLFKQKIIIPNYLPYLKNLYQNMPLDSELLKQYGYHAMNCFQNNKACMIEFAKYLFNKSEYHKIKPILNQSKLLFSKKESDFLVEFFRVFRYIESLDIEVVNQEKIIRYPSIPLKTIGNRRYNTYKLNHFFNNLLIVNPAKIV